MYDLVPLISTIKIDGTDVSPFPISFGIPDPQARICTSQKERALFLASAKGRMEINAFALKIQALSIEFPLAFKIEELVIGGRSVKFGPPLLLDRYYYGPSIFVPLLISEQPNQLPNLLFALYDNYEWKRFTALESSSPGEYYGASTYLRIFDWRFQKALDKILEVDPLKLLRKNTLVSWDELVPGQSSFFGRAMEDSIQAKMLKNVRVLDLTDPKDLPHTVVDYTWDKEDKRALHVIANTSDGECTYGLKITPVQVTDTTPQKTIRYVTCISFYFAQNSSESFGPLLTPDTIFLHHLYGGEFLPQPSSCHALNIRGEAAYQSAKDFISAVRSGKVPDLSGVMEHVLEYVKPKLKYTKNEPRPLWVSS